MEKKRTKFKGCGRCHTCGTKLELCLDGEEWCPTCGKYRRYVSHGWSQNAIRVEDSPCPEIAMCPWCGREHFVREHPQCSPDAYLEAMYEERFEIYDE